MSHTTASISLDLETYIRDHFHVAAEDTYFNRDLHLWKEGYVDSTGAVEVVAFLEERYDLRLPDEVLFDPTFTSINGIAAKVFELLNG